MYGERPGDYGRGGQYDRRDGRDRYDRQDRSDRPDRYDRGGRDRPDYGREDRRGRERPAGDRPGRDNPSRGYEGGPSGNRPSSGRPPGNRPPGNRPPASRPGEARPATARRDTARRDAAGPVAKPATRTGRSARVRGIAVMLAVIATASLAITGYAVSLAVLNHAHLGRTHSSAAGSYVVTGIASFVSSNAIVSALDGANPAKPVAAPSAPPPVSLTLTARDKANCPAAATACVDLAEHITWLQDNGKVSYGPVQMEPGPPGTAHATPTGTFNVAWKAGPTYMSTIYHELIPWAVFFAPGGIAFHEGSLTVGSHGCVHLTMDAAHYYNQHLPVGAEVVVF